MSSFNEKERLLRGYLRLVILRCVIVLGRLSKEWLNSWPNIRCVKEGGKMTLSIELLNLKNKIRCVKECGKITLSIGWLKSP